MADLPSDTQPTKQVTQIETHKSKYENSQDKGKSYRIENEKMIDINNLQNDPREKAKIVKIISYGLFGNKRFRNIYLKCSLNNFFNAILIANTIQQRVENLSLVIKFEIVPYQLHTQGKQKTQGSYSIFSIKLTQYPTQDDRKQPGFQNGLQSDQLKQSLKDYIYYLKKYPGLRVTSGKRSYNYNNRDNYQKNRYYKNYHKDQRRDKYQPTKNQQHKEQYQKKYRETKHEAVKEQGGYKRGQQKSRGEPRAKPTTTQRVAQHNYVKEHLNRDVQNRGDRRPKGRNRYEEDD